MRTRCWPRFQPSEGVTGAGDSVSKVTHSSDWQSPTCRQEASVPRHAGMSLERLGVLIWVTQRHDDEKERLIGGHLDGDWLLEDSQNKPDTSVLNVMGSLGVFSGPELWLVPQAFAEHGARARRSVRC